MMMMSTMRKIRVTNCRQLKGGAPGWSVGLIIWSRHCHPTQLDFDIFWTIHLRKPQSAKTDEFLGAIFREGSFAYQTFKLQIAKLSFQLPLAE